MTVLTDAELRDRRRSVLGRGWIDIPEGYGGSGAPGVLLESLLGVSGGNLDTPDAGRWELKFHSGKSLLTLFHLEASPKGHMHDMVRKFGWPDKDGRISFRHTIHRGHSAKGFSVENADGRIIVHNPTVTGFTWPYWTHDQLINAFAAKFRRLIVVRGRRSKGRVRYESAHMYWEPKVTLFMNAIADGVIAIDFDARTTEGDGLRNHGTKFRVSYEALASLYPHHEDF